MNLRDIESRKKEIRESIDNDFKAIRDIVDETDRIIEITTHSEEILDGIDAEFEKNTSLNKIDSAFVFMVVMLQSVRWIMAKELKMPELNDRDLSISKDERLKSRENNHKGGTYDGKSSGVYYEQEELKKYREQHKDKDIDSQSEFYKKKCKHRTWAEILMQPVPYDAMNALDKDFIPNIAGMNSRNENGSYNNIYGKNHHVATLGHDPVLGWVFGVANIMTSTISFVNFRNYEVIRGHSSRNFGFTENRELSFSDQVIDYANPVTILNMIRECMLSIEEDAKRLPAAVVRHAIHLESDKYCIEGLPIPVLSIINPQKSQELIEEGWNSVEFSKIMEEVLGCLKYDLKELGISAILNILINMISAIIYLFCLNNDEEMDIRKVKVAKILSVANVISASSNVLYVALSKRLGKLDVVGIGSALIALFSSERFIGEMKREYIKGNFEDLILDDQYKHDWED